MDPHWWINQLVKKPDPKAEKVKKALSPIYIKGRNLNEGKQAPGERIDDPVKPAVEIGLRFPF